MRTTKIECPNCSHGIKITLESKPKPEISQDRLFAEEIFATFPAINAPDGYFLRKSFVDKWKTTFPGVRVESEVRAALAWCEANPTKRKTSKGILRFLVAWLMRARDKANPPQREETPEEIAKRIQSEREFERARNEPPPWRRQEEKWNQ